MCFQLWDCTSESGSVSSTRPSAYFGHCPESTQMAQTPWAHQGHWVTHRAELHAVQARRLAWLEVTGASAAARTSTASLFWAPAGRPLAENAAPPTQESVPKHAKIVCAHRDAMLLGRSDRGSGAATDCRRVRPWTTAG